ncbi:transposase [Neisseria weixii]|uniref:transposase n=1 Tax=Neisseria weixii TaxID=1853276 RepID=UPI0022B761A5|nr:transposase [Neisseria weixii]
MLIPNLPEGSMVVMDNAAFHKGEAQQLPEEKGHTVLRLPPYSPDLNPIERCWAAVKSLRRKWRLDDADVLFGRVLGVEN